MLLTDDDKRATSDCPYAALYNKKSSPCGLLFFKLLASAFCREFGGGGHIRAAGCEITGSLEEVKAKLLKQAEKVLG